MREDEFDFVAIGDTVTDAFIRLEDAMVDKDKNMLCMRFKDKIPYKEVVIVPAVGNSANAAVSAARLGLKTAFITNLGADDWGEECKNKLVAEHVDTKFVVQQQGKKTNYHYVLWFEDDRTILVKHEEYDYVLPDFGTPRWVYLSSAGGNSLPFHMALADYLDAHPDIKLAFQPGTYQMKFGKEALERIYKRADFFVCNKEEAERILETGESDIKKLLHMMASLGPKLTVITDGKIGAFVYDGKDVWVMPSYPDPKPPYERTGAGDAFSSTFAAFLALGLSMEDALTRAPINSMSVVQYVGAQEGLLSRDKIEEYLTKAPEDYKPQKV
ncbi:MAG: Sugar kinase, ribokinase family [Parcubacteria group bacterium Gr01-1014_29]|nr:MAG: Sugar kinase, ribokinase family [Parcubacteria group bacterium Gr01-1014_29]